MQHSPPKPLPAPAPEAPVGGDWLDILRDFGLDHDEIHDAAIFMLGFLHRRVPVEDMAQAVAAAVDHVRGRS